MRGRTLRVCYFGTYRAEYSRNQIMIEGLRRNGVEVVECHERLWLGTEDRIQVASGGWMRPGFIIRLARVYWRLLKKHRQVGDYDIMVLGYPGQLDAYLAHLLTRLRRKPLVLDVLTSLYLMASERGLAAQDPINARLIYGIEKLACLLPELLILDTHEYAEWFQKVYGLSPERFRVVLIGADDRIFHPIDYRSEDKSSFSVIYYGSFIPQHGISYILEAARILLKEDPDLHFELIGDGPVKPQAEEFVRKYNLTNVSFTGWVKKDELPLKIAKAGVCLGAFGKTPQSMITIHNKVYEALAMAKPVITGDSPAVRRWFVHKKHLYLCKRADALDLARSIKQLKDNPDLRKEIAMEGYAHYKQHFTIEHIGASFKEHLLEILARDRFSPS